MRPTEQCKGGISIHPPKTGACTISDTRRRRAIPFLTCPGLAAGRGDSPTRTLSSQLCHTCPAQWVGLGQEGKETWSEAGGKEEIHPQTPELPWGKCNADRPLRTDVLFRTTSQPAQRTY